MTSRSQARRIAIQKGQPFPVYQNESGRAKMMADTLSRFKTLTVDTSKNKKFGAWEITYSLGSGVSRIEVGDRAWRAEDTLDAIFDRACQAARRFVCVRLIDFVEGGF